MPRHCVFKYNYGLLAIEIGPYASFSVIFIREGGGSYAAFSFILISIACFWLSDASFPTMGNCVNKVVSLITQHT